MESEGGQRRSFVKEEKGACFEGMGQILCGAGNQSKGKVQHTWWSDQQSLLNHLGGPDFSVNPRRFKRSLMGHSVGGGASRLSSEVTAATQ